ncbi:MAG: winged helix-turn-helix domain-containing protein [Methanoregulaceae archaeon]|jgi:predicted transcriptional regulator
MADLLNVIISSEKRRNLLLLLKNKSQTWDDIKIRLNVTATGMLPQIRILEEEGLIIKSGRSYSLTDLGHLLVHFLEPFITTWTVIETEKEFWQTHDISVLPKDLLLRIRELGAIQVIESSDEEIYESHKHFQDSVLNSRSLQGIAHMVHPIYPDLFLRLARTGAQTGLIVTRKVFNIVKGKYSQQLSEWLRFSNASMYVLDEDIKFSFIVTDKYLSLTLFYHNGVFDSKRDLISSDPSALKWGEDLFTYYMNRSQKIEMLEKAPSKN